MAAVLGIRLREHHQFNIGGIALHARKIFDEISDFVCGQRKPHVAIRARQRRHTAIKNIHRGKRFGIKALEQFIRVFHCREHVLGHAVVDQRRQCQARCLMRIPAHPKRRATLNPAHRFKTAMFGDVRGFG